MKIISAAKIEEYKYTKAVEREMATLQLLSHPGIARLISTFKYTNSYYMVLEYASRGDLHTFLLQSGKLSHLQTRFVIGEVCSALHSVHENGFSFNDLKPENILITEIGHIKVMNFRL